MLCPHLRFVVSQKHVGCRRGREHWWDMRAGSGGLCEGQEVVDGLPNNLNGARSGGSAAGPYAIRAELPFLQITLGRAVCSESHRGKRLYVASKRQRTLALLPALQQTYSGVALGCCRSVDPAQRQPMLGNWRFRGPTPLGAMGGSPTDSGAGTCGVCLVLAGLHAYTAREDIAGLTRRRVAFRLSVPGSLCPCAPAVLPHHHHAHHWNRRRTQNRLRNYASYSYPHRQQNVAGHAGSPRQNCPHDLPGVDGRCPVEAVNDATTTKLRDQRRLLLFSLADRLLNPLSPRLSRARPWQQHPKAI